MKRAGIVPSSENAGLVTVSPACGAGGALATFALPPHPASTVVTRRTKLHRAARAIADIIAPMRLFALRGATTVNRNEADAILDATEALMVAIMERNTLHPDDVVSCIFTLTNDLDAQFPAVAARKLGFDRVPLLCAREVPVPGSLPMVIRVLIHYYAADDHAATHVYLGEAKRLRQDLEAAQ